jgi:hypothetical protein
MKQLASERKSSKSSVSSSLAGKTTAPDLVICIRNDGYEASLELRKIYRILEDDEAGKHRLLRVVDESGDDYLYPRGNFLSVDLPAATKRAVLAAA